MIQDKNFIKQKLIHIGIILSVISVVYILFMFPTAHAAPTLKGIANGMMQYINNGASQNIYELFTDTYTDAALTFGTDFMTFCQGLGSVVAIVIMIAKLEESLARGRGDYDALSEGVIALAICLLVVLYSNDIINIINGLGNLIITAMSTHVASGNTGFAPNTFEEASSTVEAMAIIIKFFPVYLLCLLEVLAVKMVAFSIILELGVRRIFFPLAIVDVYGEGMRSSGMRYMKKYLACWVRMSLCIAVAYLGNVLIATVNTSGIIDTSNAFINQIAIGYTTIAVMLKGQDVANDIVGV